VDIDLKSFRFTTVPNHDSMQQLSIVGRKHEQNKAFSEPLSGREVSAPSLVRTTQP
jgi:hypothetical protein